MSTSKILKEKSAEDILSPTAKIFHHGDRTFEILPMTDGVLMTIADALGQVIGIFEAVTKPKIEAAKEAKLRAQQEGQEEEEASVNPLANLTATDVLPILPQLIKVLLPNATKIIAAGIGEKEEWVAQNLRIASKLEALRLILEAEDIPLILKNFTALTELIGNPLAID